MGARQKGKEVGHGLVAVYLMNRHNAYRPSRVRIMDVN